MDASNAALIDCFDAGSNFLIPRRLARLDGTRRQQLIRLMPSQGLQLKLAASSIEPRPRYRARVG